MLASAPGFAQTSSHVGNQSGAAAVAPASAPAIPEDPNKRMLLAAQVNGLSSVGTQPWHIKAHYQTFDIDGKPKNRGVFEEWWAGPDKWKISYTSDGFNQVRYRTGKKTLMTGDNIAPTLADEMLERSVTYPIPAPKAIKGLRFVVQDTKDGPVALTCLREKSMNTLVPVFCFDKNSPAVRLEALPDGNMMFFNDIVSVDGKFVSKRIDVQFANAPVVSAQVTMLEPLAKFDDAVLEPPAGAVPALMPPALEPSYDVHLISVGKPPKTPPIAKAAHVHGTVILAIMVSPKGDVSEVRVISGPAMLRQAAIESVKAYRFEPYKVKGQPTAMEEIVMSHFY